jgi:hypothetical protein
LKPNAFCLLSCSKSDPTPQLKTPRKSLILQIIQLVTFLLQQFRATSNCKTLQKRSFFADPQRSADPLSGAVWAYGFAVIHFCKKFSW